MEASCVRCGGGDVVAQWPPRALLKKREGGVEGREGRVSGSGNGCTHISTVSPFSLVPLIVNFEISVPRNTITTYLLTFSPRFHPSSMTVSHIQDRGRLHVRQYKMCRRFCNGRHRQMGCDLFFWWQFSKGRGRPRHGRSF